jgi:hypothetical protein
MKANVNESEKTINYRFKIVEDNLEVLTIWHDDLTKTVAPITIHDEEFQTSISRFEETIQK